MNRIERSQKKYKELFGNVTASAAASDPDFQEMLNCFIFGEVYYQGDLKDATRELIILVVLTASQTLDQVSAHVFAALNAGVSPVEIKEAMYQCAPYIGFPKTLNVLNRANAVFEQAGITLPVESQKRVTEETRFDEGLKVQKSIFGDVIDQMHRNAPDNLKHIQNYLSACCFGDIYTRSGLDVQTRELLTLCILISLGGCESQVKSHIYGNTSVGNSKDTLISAITQCLPYVGFPRTLNALNSLKEALPDDA
ncbi:4-carboxymuconolactone decarboxylase [Marispirochaeta aestuarii]|uniref:4-carboxymuconolactone decarboxylase n=1 Tax=Marispirochaeta aestuarii TaxID=1963862 RepID=A0A1Y1RYC1_9SPIO|nr:carboxymuconolactone decarboxylase family protein [Marispirochaeta aestuarii]ORC35382.1 4-carboxymuconolactone decarboxylase [Marispirochaeta aestuarii]